MVSETQFPQNVVNLLFTISHQDNKTLNRAGRAGELTAEQRSGI
jgi:hypothetical protein